MTTFRLMALLGIMMMILMMTNVIDVTVLFQLQWIKLSVFYFCFP